MMRRLALEILWYGEGWYKSACFSVLERMEAFSNLLLIWSFFWIKRQSRIYCTLDPIYINQRNVGSKAKASQLHNNQGQGKGGSGMMQRGEIHFLSVLPCYCADGDFRGWISHFQFLLILPLFCKACDKRATLELQNEEPHNDIF